MRIVVHGQQAFGRAVLERLLEASEDVVAVCTAPGKEGRPIDPLKELAEQSGIPVHQPASWKTDEALALMRSFEADVCMMAYVLLFVPQPVLDAPRLGSFQYHPSLLPMHRGPSSINWPIAQGAKETGLTIFWPDEGLDEGPVLLQKTCSIGPDDTLGSVYFDRLFPMGVDAMIESLALVKAGTAPRIDQDLSAGSYESWFGKAQAKIDWQAPARQVHDLIRAANPQPGSWTTVGETQVRLFDSTVIPGRSGVPGEVLALEEEGVTIATGEDAVQIARLRGENGGKLAAKAYADAAGWLIGTRLGDTAASG